MFVERFFVEGLAQASYLVGSGGEAAVVDPKRDVEDYLAAAEQHGARIVAIFETHPHADFVSGHLELAQRAGATVYVSARLQARYPHVGLLHGDQIRIGGLTLTALDTPGHSPDSLSIYVEGEGNRAVFTGDVLFVGDVGRPDLRDAEADPRAMAEALYRTLHDVLLRLPDDTVVYPAHGAGSLCGRKIGTAPHTTIGAEKRVNWANQFATQEEFVRAMVSNLPDRPSYFGHDVAMNLAGARPLSEVPRPRLIGPEELRRDHPTALVLDTRDSRAYGESHLAGSLNVGIGSPMFSTWTGFFVGPETPLVLVVSDPEAAEIAWLELARLGYERAEAYLLPDAPDWRAAGLEVRQTQQLEACCVGPWLREGRALLDVRTPAEWETGHVEGARWIPLPELPERLADLPAGPIAVMCGSGYRSSVAASLLERAGVAEAVNVAGGWSAWVDRECPEPDALDLFCWEQQAA